MKKIKKKIKKKVVDPIKKIMQIGRSYFQRDQASGLYPLFSMEIRRRVANKEATNIVVVGEAGSGKSYIAMQLALTIDKPLTKKRKKGFGINQVIFTYKDYMLEVQRGKMGMPIVFDEPSYAMGKREWYKQINMALVKTMESQRFMVRPLIIPIINLNLLDKTVRNYLIQFQVHVTSRGKAMVYRIRPSQASDKVYRYLFCTLHYPILDPNCQKKKELVKRIKNIITQRKKDGKKPLTKQKIRKMLKEAESCLGCIYLSKCPTLRAQYERKKADTQLGRYDEALELATKLETKELTLENLVEMIKPFAKTYIVNDKVDTRILRYLYRAKLGINVGYNKSYQLTTMLEMERKQKKE